MACTAHVIEYRHFYGVPSLAKRELENYPLSILPENLTFIIGDGCHVVGKKSPFDARRVP